MTDNEIGWRFPPTGGGESHGYNHSGIAHFGGSREQSLAREVLQNSLDASASLGDPVHVEFDIVSVEDDWFGKESLAGAVDACIEGTQDEKALGALAQAQEILRQPQTTFLRIADGYTTGLHGEKWQTLVKKSGASFHEPSGAHVTAGGSYGIGKNAPFAVSPLRTVFYWTRFEESGRPRELFQGKAVLMTHEVDGEEVQGTGYFGLVDGCLELEGPAVPAAVRRTERQRTGTSLWIAGFPERAGWQERIAGRVVTSFFGAIADGQLTVTIEPSKGMKSRGMLTIDAESLGAWFDYLEEIQEDGADPDRELRDARLFWELRQGATPVETEMSVIGHCRLWIRVDEEVALPRKVGLMRTTGMLITSEQKLLRSFPGTRPFVAICQFDGEEGNALLRQMENPTHDQFEPDRIEHDASTQKRAREALRRIRRWIRQEVQKAAAPVIDTDPVRLTELDRLLPDLDPEDPFGSDGNGDGGREPTFGGSPTILLKPRRKPRAPGPPDIAVGEQGDEGDDDPEPMSGTGGNGVEGGDAEDGTRAVDETSDGAKGAGSGTHPAPPVRIDITDVRLIPFDAPATKARVSFLPEQDAAAAVIVLAEAGDSAKAERADVRVLDGKGLVVDEVALKAGKRASFELEADEPLGGRAWLITATAKPGDADEV